MKDSSPSQPLSTLIFIPDISGFTNFVNDTEVTHAMHIIEELLNGIIDSNILGLEVSEIEGDAILFYRRGEAPNVNQLLDQIRKMFISFHTHLKSYDTHRICECGACSAAKNLTLKFVVHYGEVAENNIGGHRKLFGKDLIIAYRLLKNSIDSHEYSLFTKSVLESIESQEDLPSIAWATPENGHEEYETGVIEFSHLSLTPLYEMVPDPSVDDFNLKGELTEILRAESIVRAPLDLTFDVVADLQFRDHWFSNITGSGELNGKITKNGSCHRCIIKGDKNDPFMYSHSFDKNGESVSFRETDIGHGIDSFFKLTRRADGHTDFLYVMFMVKNPVKKILFDLFKKSIYQKVIDRNNELLKEYCERLVREGKRHPNRIELN